MKLTTIEVKTIDRAEATRILAEFPYERQRNVNPNYVKYYASMMLGGEWLSGTEIDIAYSPDDEGSKRGHLINGRHRLQAVIAANTLVDFVIKSFDCVNENEVARLYGMIDTGRSRNVNDYLRALDTESEFGFSPSFNTKLSAAAGLILANFRIHGRTELTPGERLNAMRRYSAAASVYSEILSDVSGRVAYSKMKTSPVMSVALVTLDEAASVFGEEKVGRFWVGLGKNDGLRIGDPRKVAHAHLFEEGGRMKNKRSSVPYTARYLASCFNAWVENREIKNARVSDANAPINIAGTSFVG